MDSSESNIKNLERLARLVRLSGALIQKPDLESFSDGIVEECAAIVSAEKCFLFLVDRDDESLNTLLFPPGKKLKLRRGEGLEGWVMKTGDYIISDNPIEDSRYSPKLAQAISCDIRNSLIIPFINKRLETFGVLEAINKTDGGFTNEDFLLLRTAVAEISINLENAQLYNDLKQTFNSLVEVMASTIDARHPISHGHSRRVATYAVGIAREMELDENEIEQIRIASLLHDYGKIGVHDSILRKEGSLTPEEYETIKDHARITHDIVSKMHFSRELADVPTIASCHHERWDGDGYPFGMAGEAIPLGSRIIAVADVFDAITTVREYKYAKSFEDGFREVVAESGTQFDPQIIEAFERYFAKVLSKNIAKKRKR
ncbi:MAG TPA: HD domain-containing protein [candidate division Zixibacteria bacterium]|nr:HD domain-containing protein [candidate division Zixibacteria bacterium]